MFVAALELVDFRSYEHVTLSLEPGVTLFVGANGQGKTNIVEALGYLATLGSHRVAADQPLIRQGCERAVVRSQVVRDDRQLLLEIELVGGRANRARVNKSPLPHTRELLGILRTVLFAPEDLALVKGDPDQRRRFIDELLILRTPRLAGVRADFDRVVKQRNALLKSAAATRGRFDESTLEVWNEHLVATASELLAARLALVVELQPHVAESYTDLAPSAGDADLSYRASWRSDDIAIAATQPPSREEIASELVKALDSVRSDELVRGVSLVGPHRDDLVIQLGDLPAKGYASHGESWSLALSLRLAAFALLRSDGDDPILILDDVFAELDEARRTQLAAMVSPAEQVLITAAVAGDVPATLGGITYTVSDGEVHGGP